jgi:hypothetical protein
MPNRNCREDPDSPVGKHLLVIPPEPCTAEEFPRLFEFGVIKSTLDHGVIGRSRPAKDSGNFCCNRLFTFRPGEVCCGAGFFTSYRSTPSNRFISSSGENIVRASGASGIAIKRMNLIRVSLPKGTSLISLTIEKLLSRSASD